MESGFCYRFFCRKRPRTENCRTYEVNFRTNFVDKVQRSRSVDENVAEYVRQIKRLRWQHLQIRGQEVEALTEGQYLDSCHGFPLVVKELSGSDV